MNAPRRALVACAMVLLCSVSLAGVSEPAVAASQQKVLKRTVKTYSNKFLDGRGAAAYEMLTKRCKATIDRKQFISASNLAKELYGGPMAFESFSATIKGRTARATYTYAASSLDQRREPWRKVSGSWRMNEC